jgi:hypothetical protein
MSDNSPVFPNADTYPDLPRKKKSKIFAGTLKNSKFLIGKLYPKIPRKSMFQDPH